MTSRQPHGRSAGKQAALLCPVLALLFVLPLLRHGPSCGHDFGFHMQSWMDASDQLRHGTLFPRWAFSPAFNAGEPRFVFYPPISWLLGAVLVLLLPPIAVPTVYTVLALTAASLAMYSLARRFTSPGGSLLAAAVYIGNPYIFFTAFERTAFAELLAAAWMPLLFRAALAKPISPVGVAIPLALLWLTNAPAAVMGTYAFGLIVLLRVVLDPLQGAWRRLKRSVAGLLLGLALPAFYLLPAAFERRYVQIAMAIIPNMRVEDNFLFGHTGNGPHDQVLHTASVIALELSGLTAAVLLLALIRQRTTRQRTTRDGLTPLPGGSRDPHREVRTLAFFLAVLIFALLWHATLPLWHRLPELAFLQFPWRLLAVLGCVLGLAAALALPGSEVPMSIASVAAIAIISAGAWLAYAPLHQVCEANDLPADRIALFRAHHGVGPTDEYTPITADNDALRWHDPAFWLALQPNSPAPGTLPNPAASDPNYDAPPPLPETVSGQAPLHLQLHLQQPEDLILNLRDYPAWAVTVNGNPHPERLGRDDGLLAVALPPGASTVDVHWKTLPDVWAGDALSLAALGVAIFLQRRSRKIGS